jgi:hypothetical protein
VYIFFALKEAIIMDDDLRKEAIKEYLEAVMLGEIKEERIVINKGVSGASEAEIIEVVPSVRSRTEAAKALGETVGLFKNETIINVGGSIEAAYARLSAINAQKLEIDFDGAGEE